MLLKRRQSLLRKLPQQGTVTRLLLLVEEANRVVVIRNHLAHVLIIEGFAMQGLKLLARPYCSESSAFWHLDTKAGPNRRQLLIRRRVILDHPFGEPLNLAAFSDFWAILLSSTSAMTPLAASLTKVLSSRFSVSLAAAVAAGWLG